MALLATRFPSLPSDTRCELPFIDVKGFHTFSSVSSVCLGCQVYLPSFVDHKRLAVLLWLDRDTKGDSPTMPDDIEEPLDSRQAARMLGVKPRMAINLAKQGKIPYFRVGDLWRFLRSDIQTYIDMQREQAVAKRTEKKES